MKSPNTLILLLLSLSASATQAQNGGSLHLKDCMQYAVNHSPKVEKARLEVLRGEQMVRENLSIGLPQVNINGVSTYNALLPTSYIPNFFQGNPEELIAVKFGTNWNSQLGIELDQMIYNQTFNLGVAATRKVSEFYQIAAEKSKEDILLDVARLYYQIQMTAQQRNILQANLDQIVGLLKIVQGQYENGLAKKIDVDQLRVNRLNIENQLQNLTLQQQQQEYLLKYNMQMPLETPLELADTISEKDFILPDPAAVKPQFMNRIDLLLLDKQLELHRLNLARYRAGYFPTAYFYGNYNWQGQANNFGDYGKSRSWADNAALGIRLQIPVFDGFLKNSKMEQVKIDMLETEQDRKFAVSSFQLQHQNALKTLQVQLNSLRSLSETRTLSEEVYRISQSRFKEGIAPLTEVMSAETAMREAQTNYLSALYQLKIAELELKQVNGELVKMLN